MYECTESVFRVLNCMLSDFAEVTTRFSYCIKRSEMFLYESFTIVKPYILWKLSVNDYVVP